MELFDEHILLSQRERDIIALIADGHSAKGIAQKMQLSHRTVERHIENCRFNLRARSASQLVSMAVPGGHLVLPGQPSPTAPRAWMRGAVMRLVALIVAIAAVLMGLLWIGQGADL